MKLSVWTYEGPPHVGAMRVATAMKDMHFVLHAPQGDTYADLLFTMIDRRSKRPPVTYTTFQARDLGADTSDLFQTACRQAFERFKPSAMIVGASCTAELIQDDPGGLAERMGLPIPIIPVELPSYQRKENFGVDETFFQIVKHLSKPMAKTTNISCNILGATALGFRHRDDLTELKKILSQIGVAINVVAPLDASVSDIQRLACAHFNVLLYPENAEMSCRWLEKEFDQKYTKVVPIGVGATKDFVREVGNIIDAGGHLIDRSELRFDWWSKSVDSTYFTGKRVFIFGDGTHVKSSARIARDEMGFEVVGLGCFNREYARNIRNLGKEFNVEALITDDYLEVERLIAELQPEMILGTQMERHIGKRLGIPCAVISAPFHVQDNPARYSPQVGWEGANVIFDTWVHPLVMGLEEHLLHMFRDDFEFNDVAGPSHHGANSTRSEINEKIDQTEAQEEAPIFSQANEKVIWLFDAEKELKKIPFFVRGKARRNTETYAMSLGLTEISIDTLYEAKAHYAS